MSTCIVDTLRHMPWNSPTDNGTDFKHVQLLDMIVMLSYCWCRMDARLLPGISSSTGGPNRKLEALAKALTTLGAGKRAVLPGKWDHTDRTGL